MSLRSRLFQKSKKSHASGVIAEEELGSPPSPRGQTDLFFRLPRELRDEIYVYLLTFQTDITPGFAMTAPRYPSCCRERLFALQGRSELSNHRLYPHVLRVNKQIHNEAAMVLYGRNRFVLRLATDSRAGFQRRWRRFLIANFLGVGFSSPWLVPRPFEPDFQESNLAFYFVHTIWYLDKKVYNSDHYLWDCFCGVCAAGESRLKFVPLPAVQYRCLLRYLRIELCDIRILRKSSPMPGPDHLRKLLLPFAYRLRELMDAAGAGPGLMIEIRAKLRPRNSFTARFTEGGNGIPDVNAYKELVNTLWPLTTGPWRYKVTLPDCGGNTEGPGEDRYGLRMKDLLRRCRDETKMTPEDEKQCRQLEINNIYYWVQNGDVYQVREGAYHTRYYTRSYGRRSSPKSKWYNVKAQCRAIYWTVHSIGEYFREPDF
ncbi:hypothetical protein TWF730_010689 [Orbilia blumenaviensis]|uniref:Uncharacterized protein n=1 Tax=Orbilia blumenaviensis TaxID=1796055 RepID=A0AAV9UQI8_9PEZI